MSLVFYDTETTGTETAFDQILQFGTICTDADLVEIDRFEIRCRLQPHIVPAPGAMRVTKVTAAQLTDGSYPSHYEMVRAIRAKLLSWSPATFVGYNSIKFDENLLRQAFYQTLHPPYLTSTPGNARCDVMRAVQASSLFAPNALALPLGDKGKRVFKLDRVAPANGFSHDKAHDAMADVEATIHLARLLRDRAPDLWSAIMRFGTKAAAIDYMTSEPVFCACEIYYAKPYAWALTALGASKKSNATFYAYDLSVPPEELQGLSASSLQARFGQSPKPVRVIKSNGAPILMPYPDALEFTSARDIDEGEIERRAAFFEDHPDLRDRLIAAYEAAYEEFETSPYVEAQLYDDFTSNADLKILDKFHDSPWETRPALLDTLTDRRLRELGTRLIFIERPDVLDAETRWAHERMFAERILGKGGEVPWLTLPKALADVNEMLVSANDDVAGHLEGHREWLERRLRDAEKICGRRR